MKDSYKILEDIVRESYVGLFGVTKYRKNNQIFMPKNIKKWR